MKGNTYEVVSGVVFGIVAALQVVRAVLQTAVQVGSQAIPVWISWAAALVAGSLCVWAFRTAGKANG